MSAGDVYTAERSFSVAEADDRLAAFLSARDLTREVDYADPSWQVTRVTLRDRNGTALASGAGKGTHHETGATAEAIEHLLFARSDWERALRVSVPFAAKQSAFRADHLLQDIAERHRGKEIPVEVYTTHDGEDVFVPSAYVDPQMFNAPAMLADPVAGSLAKYCSNTGGAIGLSEGDSKLHGLNEAIERHHESLLFQAMMGFPTSVDWHVVGTCPAPARQKLDRIRRDFGETRLIVARTRQGNSVSFALGPVLPGTHLASIGAGCSVSAAGAVQRAVDELAQTLLLAQAIGLRDEDWRADDRSAAAMLSESPRLSRLIDWVSSWFDDLPEAPPAVFQGDGDFAAMDVPTQFATLAGRLKDQGIAHAYRVHFQQDDLSLVKTYVPSFDKFFTIRRGNRVIPLWAYKARRRLTPPD